MLLTTGLMSLVFVIVHRCIFRRIDRVYPPMQKLYVERDHQFRVLCMCIGTGLVSVIIYQYAVLPPPSILWQIAGVSIASIGLMLCVSARVELASSWGNRIAAQPSQHLVTSGPYQHIRHPYYIGVLIISCGFGVFSRNAPILVVALCWFGSMVLRVEAEDRSLHARFGRHYASYYDAVPPFFPRFRVRQYMPRRLQHGAHSWRIRKT